MNIKMKFMSLVVAGKEISLNNQFFETQHKNKLDVCVEEGGWKTAKKNERKSVHKLTEVFERGVGDLVAVKAIILAVWLASDHSLKRRSCGAKIARFT
jgi:hypothetical protein